MYIIKEKRIKIDNQSLEMACQITICVRKKDTETISNIFQNLLKVNITKC